MSFDFTAFLLLYICVGIAIGYFIDDFALLTKSFGGLYKSNAIASNLGSIIYLVNRVFIAMTLPALGFIIDSGVEIDVIVITLIVSSLLLVFFKILAYSKIFKIILLLKWFAEKIYGKNEYQINDDRLIQIQISSKTDLRASIAMFMFISSMTIPSILAVIYFDNRGFFLQLGFAFNMVGSLIKILFIEREIAVKAEQLVHKKISSEQFMFAIATVLRSRIIGTMIFAAFLFLFLFFYI